ncbi:MAG: HAMP domain-containing sensor histidine kinase [Chloroflexota bacterium]
MSAQIYAEETLGPPEGIWLAPVVALATLLLTLGGIAWFLGRTVVEPLRAASRAAGQIAAGDLTVSLPSSRVREVGDVNRAMEAMSEGLRESVEQRAELEQERRAFISAIAHDLRTPLFSLRGALEGLRAGLATTPEKRERYVAIAQEKADALERLVSDLFDFTRLEYLDQSPSREQMDLNEVLGRLVEGMQPRAEWKEITLDFRAPHDPIIVDADEYLLSRAIENLLDNALRFTPAGGVVEVECLVSEKAVGFSVSDSGPGIASRDLPHIFQPLFQAESSRSGKSGGSGLGLTIARRIVRAHSGELTAGNTDRGAVFTAWLPRPSTGAV